MTTNFAETAPTIARKAVVRTLRFDTLVAGPQGSTIPTGYGGLQWLAIGVGNRSDAEATYGTGTGYTTGVISGEQFAYTAGNGRLTSGSTANFSLKSLYLTSAFRDDETVTITGYDDGVALYERTVIINDEAALRLRLNFDGVDAVTFRASGGTPSGMPQGFHIVFDDVRVDITPGSISGVVFDDADANGRRNDGEDGLADRLVYIDENRSGAFDRGERSTRTDADGRYAFADVPLGAYDVSFGPGRGRVATTQPVESYHYRIAVDPDSEGYPGLSRLVTPLGPNGTPDLNNGVHVMQLTTPLELWGNTYTQLYIGVDGVISFNGLLDYSYINRSLPQQALGPLIAPFWTDLTFAHGGDLLAVEDSTTGTIAVTWSNVQYGQQTTTTRSSFQTIISRDGTIEFHYFTLGALPAADDGVTIGVQGQIEDGATQYLFGRAIPAGLRGVDFLPPHDGTAQVIVDSHENTRVNFGAARVPPAVFGDDTQTLECGRGIAAPPTISVADLPLLACV